MFRSVPYATQALLALAVASVCSPLGAQIRAQARVQVVGGIGNVGEQEKDPQDAGPSVEMFESPNLDRFVRRARRLLDEERFEDGIAVLQAVIDGKTIEAQPAEEGEPTDKPATDGDAKSTEEPVEGQQQRKPKPGKDGKQPEKSATNAPTDPRQAVFSSDGRVYRPAARLCQEYLATMPPVGVELYQARYESLAQALLDVAHGDDARSFEQVTARYFPTLASGRALHALADLHMQNGRYRAAVQALRDLVDIYPKANLQRIGVSPLWCRFRIALCMRMSGDVTGAQAAVAALATEHPDESLRVMGELTPVRDLPTSKWFATPLAASRSLSGSIDATWIEPSTDRLQPLWTYRFEGNDPYEAVQGGRGNRDTIMFGGPDGGAASTSAPPANKYGVGTQVAFFGDGASRAVFLENFRLRVAETSTGLLVREGDGEELPAKPLENRPRPRVPVYDRALMTPVEDEERCYVVLGHNRVTQNAEPLKRNAIVAYDKRTCARLWSSEDLAEKGQELEDVTFLAAPTRFSEQLLVPVLKNGVYALQCLDRKSGKPLWRTQIHSGGSRYYKAPGARALVTDGMAYVLTNAGTLAAIDAYAGDLRWVRKYERTDPLRQKPAKRKSDGNANGFWRGNVFSELDLAGALPSDVFAHGGAIAFAACDSDMLMCVDGATGEPVWMLDGTTRYAPYGKLRHVVGTWDGLLFFESSSDLKDHLVCVEMASGIVRWSIEIPRAGEKLTRWPGRGCVTAGHVLLPGDRVVHALDVEGRGPWRAFELPAASVGDAPLRGPNNLFAAGSWLAVCYGRGIEVYSTPAELRRLAASASDVEERARALVLAGDLDEALDALVAALDKEGVPPPDAAIAERRVTQAIAIARDLSISAQHKSLKPLDRLSAHVSASAATIAWRLARLDACRALSLVAEAEREQEALYRSMEGR